MPTARKIRLPAIPLLCFQALLALSQPDIALIAPSLPHQGQAAGSIEGVARDAETGELLPLVNIRLADTLVGTSTEFDGAFEIAGLKPGEYTLLASYVGYEAFRLERIKVQAGQSTAVAIALEPAAVIAGEVVVTATLKPQAVKLAPASIGIVTSKQIRERNITTFDQAFDEVPGVVVTRSSGANVQAFSIRGASEVAGGGIGNRVLLLIDGRPAISPESGGALWNLVPLNSIARIEVVKGAYSSLYGSSAMGGVINVITHKPEAEPEMRLHVNYGFFNRAPASTGYTAYNDFRTIEGSYSRRTGKFAYLLDGGWKANDGHREKSGFDLYNFYGKASWQFSNNRFLQLSGNVNRIKNDTPATWFSTRQAYSVAPHRRDDYQDRRELNTDLYYYALPNSRVKYSSRFYYYHNYSRFTFDGDQGNDSTNVNFGKQLVAESSVQTQRLGNVTQLDLYTRSSHYIIAGTDVKWDHVVGLPDTVLYGRHQALSLGAYIQDEITFSEKLIANLGVRFDHYNILQESVENNISPKLAVAYNPRSGLSFRMLLAQAFRNPAMAERFIKFEQGGGLRFRPNPNLRSEKLVLSVEIGSKIDIAPGVSLDAALFYNRYNGLISFQQLSKPLEPLLYEVINLKAAVMQGLELSYQHRLKDFLILNLGYTFLDAKDVSEGRLNDELAYKVRHTFSASATAYRGPFTFNVNGRYRSRIREVFIYPGSEPDAAFIANAKLNVKIADHYNCYIAVDNIGNEQYEELERYRMPGRSYTMGAVVRF
ncbi:MAG: TonB-dependent receptor [Lewinellaceae bacterium]|nr:TonB-dependent receptor [Phaeodactylibacter sp.]MCB9037845.1 TonB-dependent receptor [Lewinellaceae bacterium]